MISTRSRVWLLGLIAACASGCASTTMGRVVTDVRIAGGWISVDRCELQQVMGRGVRVRNCQTENYYLGHAAIPLQTSTAETYGPR